MGNKLPKFPRRTPEDRELDQNNPQPKNQKKVCTTGKQCFSKRNHASHGAHGARRKYNDPFIEPYKCDVCPWWHIGHPQGTQRMREELEQYVPFDER